MSSTLRALALAVVMVPAAFGSLAQAAGGGDGYEIPRQAWSFSGFTGKYDTVQLQRGYQVYREICASCHGVKRIAFRNLVQPGGPSFPEPQMKLYAATYKVKDGPNDAGKMFERPAKLSDLMPSPYANEQEARSIHNGAYPPDLSVIIRARGIETEAPWYKHIFLMARDVLTGYQEGGSDYAFGVLTSYADDAPPYVLDGSKYKPLEPGKKDPKAVKCASISPGKDGKPDVCNVVQDGLYYNRAFPGNQIAMVNPFAGGDGAVKYALAANGKPTAPETVEQYARDVTAFLSWASDPTLDQRKQLGWQVMLYLLITSLLLYIAKKRIWAKAH